MNSFSVGPTTNFETLAWRSRPPNLSTIPNSKRALVKNPSKTTGNRPEIGELLFFQAITTRSGLVRFNEMFGFLPYMLLLLRAARLRLYRTLSIMILAALPVAFYPSEAVRIFRLFLAFAGFSVNNSGLSQPGPYSLLGNFSQLTVISQFDPLLLSETIVLGVAIFDTFRQRMNIERLVFYVALSSICIVLFSNLVAFWFWLLPVCLLYAIIMEKNDLGAFMLVFGTSIAFLEVTYAFGSSYLILGTFSVVVPGLEGIQNSLKILSIMVTLLTVLLSFLLKHGRGQASHTLLRTSGLSVALYVLLYFWLVVYPF